MKNKDNKRNISVTLDEDVIRKLRDKAIEEDRSISGYVNLLLKKEFEKDNYSESRTTT